MNILMIGSGAGSWTMRGLQLGQALGARVVSAPTQADLSWADVIVLVKRAILTYGRIVSTLGKRIVWDALDFWSQPAQNTLNRASAIALAMQHASVIKPDLIVCATQAMADDLGGICLRHHGYHGLTPTAARDVCRIVAYDGNAIYLDAWAPVLKKMCADRGWSFVVNPSDLSSVDILVSLRGGIWDGWICREWKSGVKMVNAMLAGRPIISQDCAAARELGPDGSIIETAAELDAALDYWSLSRHRRDVVTLCRERSGWFDLPAVASSYRLNLEALPC